MAYAEQSGAVVWEGRSRLDPSAPIAVIVTWTSNNEGTGPMAQSWILRTDIPPVEAIRTDKDLAVCPASCGLRPGASRELDDKARCYAARGRTAMALGGMFKALPRYPRIPVDDAARRLSGSRLRIGAYGDPAAVPVSVWASLLRHTQGHTGYTHAPELAPMLRGIVMASSESAEHAARLQAAGWRTYRVRSVDEDGRPEPLVSGEVVCPKSHESFAATGRKRFCAECLLCDGTMGRSARSIAIVDHSQVSMRRRRATGDLTSSPVVQIRRSLAGGVLEAPAH